MARTGSQEYFCLTSHSILRRPPTRCCETVFLLLFLENAGVKGNVCGFIAFATCGRANVPGTVPVQAVEGISDLPRVGRLSGRANSQPHKIDARIGE